jgi:hypothetical protein
MKEEKKFEAEGSILEPVLKSLESILSLVTDDTW